MEKLSIYQNRVFNKKSQRCYFAWENLQWGFCDVGVLHFRFRSSFFVVVSSFVDVLYFVVFLLIDFWSHPSPFRGLSPGFLHLILYFQSSPSQSDLRETFICSTIPSCRERCGLEWPFFIHKRFLPYAPSPTFQPAFTKVSLGAGSSSLKFAGLHTDPGNTDPVHLFVWFTSFNDYENIYDGYYAEAYHWLVLRLINYWALRLFSIIWPSQRWL